jgi:hypothetical protein
MQVVVVNSNLIVKVYACGVFSGGVLIIKSIFTLVQ